MRGDCSVRVGGLGFTPEQIAACVDRMGLLCLEMDLAAADECKCAACETASHPTSKTLSSAEIRGVIDQSRQLGAVRCLLIDSEPDSYRDLFPLIDDIHGKEMQVELFANAAAISETAARFLHERQVAVVIRISSLNRDLHNWLAEDAEAFDAAHRAIDRLKRAGYGESREPRLAIRVEIRDENLAEVPDLWRWARSQGIEPYVQIITPRKGADEKPTIIPSGPGRQLFEKLGRIDQAEFGRSWNAPAALIGRSCKRHLFSCHVTPCGNIFPCVGVTIPLGNIRTEPLREILGLSDVLENIRAFDKNLKEPCRACSQTTDCYGCRGAAYQLTGDYLAGDQLCWKADDSEIQTLPASVEHFIPHGRSIRVVDRLVQIGERRSRTEWAVRPDSPFVDSFGRLDELAFIEMIAQSFAASHGFHLSAEQRRVHRGLLLGVRDLIICGAARTGDHLTVDIRKLTRFGDFGIVEGEVRHQQTGELIATAELKIWRANNQF